MEIQTSFQTSVEVQTNSAFVFIVAEQKKQQLHVEEREEADKQTREHLHISNGGFLSSAACCDGPNPA